ncbi:jg11536 [Pararge aegeria aegeria]|uniref:Jg11536 protein n=1 Tax=Pararge aegeria aegeria TaxID=348720 RepID=A0A8S4RNB7_9NEOP|nr:jg11536 [Pararge aegeria aegeria]
MERSMIGVKIIDRYSTHNIRNQTRVIDILNKIDIQKWRWAGHSQRDRQEKWSKVVTNWYPRDRKRNRGRPYRRWEDDIKQTAGPNWRRVAHDRKQWRELEEAFADRQSETRDIIN